MTHSPLFEVELKFPVRDASALRTSLDCLGVRFGPPVRQVDRYFAHPARDFAETDEALRLRLVNGRTTLTYKGPVLDGATKTRQEIEVDLDENPQSLDTMSALLGQLGFRPVREVAKLRRSAQFSWNDQQVSAGWDEVDPLGTFLELEIVTEDSGRSAARECLLDLAQELHLRQAESRSYLELMLAHDHHRLQ